MNPMLAKSYDRQNVTGWLMSEKLDGCRAIWTGTEFLSRNGNKFNAPKWFTDQLPSIMLDGELYVGRGKFQVTAGILRKKTPIDAEWKTVTYRVFDAPEYPGPFAKRAAFCAAVLHSCAVVRVVEQIPCVCVDHLQAYYKGLLSVGAEGIMLKDPACAYEQTRSASLLKYKPTQSDEAIVLERLPGTGKNKNRLGALVCQWRNIIFNLGAGITDDIRDMPPRIGAAVTFVYQGLTDGGVPRFPVFAAVRDYE